MPSAAPADRAIDVVDLRKTYRTPFRRKRVEALRGVTFSVERGHIFGFVGPNGAGKTTTIRTLMGLIRPTGGTASLLGHPLPSRAARARVGFLPEAPYFYDYLTVGELLDLAGRLFGMPAAARAKRANALIERVGLGRARSQSLKKFSKGMLQRAGLAQALMNDPELVVLDEPMSGLDPIGRKEVRDLILELRDQGKTVFFSTHILSDVEAITDRVAIIARGQLQAHGTPAELVQRTVLGVEVAVRLAADADASDLVSGAARVRRLGDELSLMLPADADVDAWLTRAHVAGARVVSVAPRHETLEDLFLRQVAGADDSAAAREGRT
ncbi:MAG: ATP-binding cassette domain-containing protein [Kofleriaceae bacterium]